MSCTWESGIYLFISCSALVLTAAYTAPGPRPLPLPAPTHPPAGAAVWSVRGTQPEDRARRPEPESRGPVSRCGSHGGELTPQGPWLSHVPPCSHSEFFRTKSCIHNRALLLLQSVLKVACLLPVAASQLCSQTLRKATLRKRNFNRE